MQWLNKIVDQILQSNPPGEVIVSSGVSPSGRYHLGTLREVLTAEAIARELKRRGQAAKHIHIVDDLDVFRKVPVDVPAEFEKYLGMPLCDVPSPDGKAPSYADYFLQDLLVAAKNLHLEMEVVRAHQKYREGFFVDAIEKTLAQLPKIKQILKSVSGREVADDWSPVQVIEDGYLKNRQFKSIDTSNKTIIYINKDGHDQAASYNDGQVKLNWRLDWPARWWLLGVQVEPFGRDHATKGGSYDTGAVLVRDIFDGEAPVPVPYNFINKTGDTKKMSKSAGDVVTAADLLKLLPAEIVWFFILRFGPDKLLFFDEGPTLIRLVDEFAELIAKPHKTADEQQLIELCTYGLSERTVSNIPFTHLVASYQASLKNADKTIEVIKRTEHAATAEADAEVIKNELNFIDEWLQTSAPDDVKFELAENLDFSQFSEAEKNLFTRLAEKITIAPEQADGAWFHNAVYELKDETKMQPKDMFTALYRLLIGKTSGPRAGWFLSILPRDWLLSRLKLEA